MVVLESLKLIEFDFSPRRHKFRIILRLCKYVFCNLRYIYPRINLHNISINLILVKIKIDCRKLDVRRSSDGFDYGAIPF